MSRTKPVTRLARVARPTTPAARATARRAPVAGWRRNSAASVPIGTSALTGRPPFPKSGEIGRASLGLASDPAIPRVRRGRAVAAANLDSPDAEHGRLQ